MRPEHDALHAGPEPSAPRPEATAPDTGAHEALCAAIAYLPQRDVPPVLDADVVAAWLRLGSDRQAFDLARRGILPTVRIGRRVLFLRDGILRALARHEAREITDEELEK